MAESFLKEQLERIRKLTEHMSTLQSHAAELTDVMAHDREALRQSPLHDVRDYRLYRDTLDAPASRPSAPRDSSRRRRRG
ncbi:MAG: hypothetical protein AUH43_05730 [Acidobacteria bacterium 13_1_40CM_65_14]|jgi:hypothetical protein|nr:MAG: hypothetical protein AUH43_05730 [Acidobacteria bacterium 13_1_40CM_65_14]